jgi:hypothetical protein
VSQRPANDGMEGEGAPEKPSVTLAGTVEKIIPPPFPGEPEKAQIGVNGADDLYREIRVENKLHGPDGTDLALKPGADVDVTIEAEPGATTPKVAGPEKSAELPRFRRG